MTSKSLKRARHKAALKKLETTTTSESNEHLNFKHGKTVCGGRKDLPNIISKALVAGHWEQALLCLKRMRESGMAPKLGAIQRWVRLADLSGREDLATQLLDSIMRTAATADASVAADVMEGTKEALDTPVVLAHPDLTDVQNEKLTRKEECASGTAETSLTCMSNDMSPDISNTGALTMKLHTTTFIRRHTPWCPTRHPETSSSVQALASDVEADILAAVSRAEGCISIVGTDKGPQMTSSNPIFMTQPGVINFQPLKQNSAERSASDMFSDASHHSGTTGLETLPAVRRVPVPFVPGAFVLTEVLSKAEAAQIVAVSERMGYAHDADYSFASTSVHAHDVVPHFEAVQDAESSPDFDIGRGLSAARSTAGGERAAGCVWLADPSLLNPVWDRIKHLLPQSLGGGALAGLNARWRLYRYDQGTVYRPHVDGAWPGSGLRDGKVVFDAFGDRWSRLTFLIYLNDGFDGGATTFYTPGQTEGVLEARGVSPSTGNVLVFPHGESAGSLVHEGSAVTQGVKYVIRTDVLYLLPGSQGSNKLRTSEKRSATNTGRCSAELGRSKRGRK
ncbi:hypothetical protein CEUSTIGMA_g5656.t1 [Chlamydomonas eustigma]|uniref:Fe2OG dioxygenase domain-containing protein n=1 Tax=Chlamydomonas eustigma TaxID=1157962 RepID=A0A250X549_9CHLO|nr:hypothetical protein CEUSTIGMA_g5656.t1 [Chlamydomonas eustigma]|eukprot:GAX78214.1 hypothetical protein CEUSTIGMA_g5656.t1 [Chlamydomonas eustigma]